MGAVEYGEISGKRMRGGGRGSGQTGRWSRRGPGSEKLTERW